MNLSPRVRSWTFAGGLGVLLVLVSLVFGGRFFSLFPELLHHPFEAPFVFLVVGLAIFLGVELLPWPQSDRGWAILRRLLDKLAEALLVVAAVVALFELPHFGDFYQKAVERVLTTTEWIRKLPSDQQRGLLESVVSARLGPGVDSAVSRAFVQDLTKELDANQYVVEERRYFEKEWTDSSQLAMRSTKRPLDASRLRVRTANVLTRRVQVIASSADHLMQDYIVGTADYDLTVDQVPCFSLQARSGGIGPPATQPNNPKICESHVTKEPSGYRVTILVHLKHGIHDVERSIQRATESPWACNSFGLDYVTESLILIYHYPSELSLEVYGHGDLEGKLQGEALTMERAEGRSFTQRFSDAWLGRGTNVICLASPDRSADRTR